MEERGKLLKISKNREILTEKKLNYFQIIQRLEW